MSMSIPRRVILCGFLGHVVDLLFSLCLAQVSNSFSFCFPRSQGLRQRAVGDTVGRRSGSGVGVCEDGPKQRGFATW